MKKFTKVAALCLSIASAFAQVGCGMTKKVGSDDETGDRSEIDVYNFDGGIGTAWLYAAEKRFEELYKDVSFEDGKMGVNVKVNAGKAAQDSIASLPYDVFFTESIVYNDLIVQNAVLDITDIVTQPLTNVKDCTETVSIEDKLFAEQKASLPALNGKYYCLPGYETYSGLSYDRQLFDKKSLFIKEGQGATQFTNLSGNLSVGPDGIRGSYDDGLPSSYEEFFKLLDRMVKMNIEPIIYSGQYPQYLSHMLLSSWVSLAGKDEWMLNVNFNSNYTEETVLAEIITGFEDGVPVTEKMEISPETGYNMSQQASKYYALEVFEKILKKPEYISTKVNSVLSHLDAQTEYVFSALEGEPIAMISEGTYWYNEAQTALKSTANIFPDTGRNRDFSFMTLPVQLTGQVTEGNGKKNTLFDGLSAYSFINSSIKDNPVKVEIAKKFLQFCYTDAEMIAFTEETGIFRGVQYNIDDDTLNNMNKYAQNLYTIRKASDVIHPISDSRIYVNAQSKFSYKVADGSAWNSTISNTSYTYPLRAYLEKKTAIQYFDGMKITQSDWNDMYSKYFN